MSSDRRYRLQHSLLLLMTSVIWGVAFSAQSLAMEHVGPFTFIACRFPLGAAALLPVIAWQERACRKERRTTTRDGRAMGGPVLWKGGILCGLALGAGSSLQQIGISMTTVGKAGFLTAMYIVLVPVLGILVGRRAKPVIWVCVGIAACGIYLLSMKGDRFAIGKGDLFCLLCAVAFSVQILLIDHYVTLVDGIRLAAVEFIGAALVGTVLMFLFEHPGAEGIFAAALPILYTGIMSSGVAYTLQIVGQRGMNPTVASLIMSLESAFAAIAGFLILHQTMSLRELAGCALMAAAIVLAQL